MNTKKAPELRIKRVNIYVGGTYGLFRTVRPIDKYMDILQYKHESGEWLDIPISENENYRVYKDKEIERDAY